jgi:hypothetical protein
VVDGIEALHAAAGSVRHGAGPGVPPEGQAVGARVEQQVGLVRRDGCGRRLAQQVSAVHPQSDGIPWIPGVDTEEGTVHSRHRSGEADELGGRFGAGEVRTVGDPEVAACAGTIDGQHIDQPRAATGRGDLVPLCGRGAAPDARQGHAGGQRLHRSHLDQVRIPER